MAGPTRANGWPDYSSTGTIKTTSQIWSTLINDKFYPITCLSKISNTRWEGEIKSKGDTVIIRQGPNITWTDGTVGEEITYNKPGKDVIELHIDKLKRFGIILDSVDEIQSDVDLWKMWAADAAEQKKIVVEQEVFHHVFTEAGHAGANAGVDGNINLGTAGAPLAVTKDNIIDVILSLGQLKDENNVPEQGRATVLPPWACSLIKSSWLSDASKAGDGTSIARNGRIGVIDRETIYMSNNLLTVTDGADRATHCISCHPKGLAFASQASDVKTGQSEKYDGDYMRGKVLFGYKANLPETLIDLYIKRG